MNHTKKRNTLSVRRIILILAKFRLILNSALSLKYPDVIEFFEIENELIGSRIS